MALFERRGPLVPVHTMHLVPDQILFAKYFPYHEIINYNFPYVFICCVDGQNCIEIFFIENY